MRPIIQCCLPALLACLSSARAAPPQETAAESRSAATRPAAPEELALERLIQELEDPPQREHLVQQLKAVLEARRAQADAALGGGPEPQGLVGGSAALLGNLSLRLRVTLSELLAHLGRLPARWQGLVDRLQEPGALEEALAQFGAGVAVVLAAALAGLLGWLALRGVKQRQAASAQVGMLPPAKRLWRLLQLAGLRLLPALLTAGVALLGLALAAPTPATRRIVLALAFALVARRLLDVAVDQVLAPRHPALRLPRLADERAVSLAAALTRLGGFAIGGALVIEVLAGLGAVEAVLSPLRGVYGLVLLGLGIALVLRERPHVRARLQQLSPAAPDDHPSGTSWRSAVASVLGLWWIAAIAYMVGLFLVWASGVTGGLAFVAGATLKTLVVVAAAALLVNGLRRGLVAVAKRGSRLGEHYPELQARVPRYLQGARLVAQVGIAVAAACVCLEAWGVSALALLASTWAESVFTALLGILLVTLCAAATIDVATVFTQRYLTAHERQGTATGKVRTLVPLARSAIRVVVIAAAALMILGQVGVQIAPLLAGVGVLGLAVGFGAQTLVKDVITGIFILLEDTLSVGDVITINGTGGLVEEINIRTVRLRDNSANVHTIPYSAVTTITNMTKGFSRWVVEASVGYDEDVDEVGAILKEIGDGIERDPELGKDILAPIEVLGLDRFEDSAVVVRARLTTRPIEQWKIGREFNRRMKKVFEERGIQIPYPHRTIYFRADEAGAPPPLRMKPARSESEPKRR